MSRKVILSLLSLWIIALLLLAGTLPTAPVRAEALLQGVPRLDGFKIYFTEANGEPSRFDRNEGGLSRFAGVLWDLGATLETLDWRAGIPDDADLIIIPGPSADISADQIARLWSYLETDASLLLMVDPLGGTTRRPTGVQAGSGLFDLTWSDMGIRVRNDVVVTEQTTAQATTLANTFTTTNLDPASLISGGLNAGLTMFGARSIELDTSTTTFQLTPLVLSPANYYGETAYQDYLESGAARYNIGDDTPRGPLALGVLAENTETNTRIALVGDSDVARNGAGLNTSPTGSSGYLYPDNVIFMSRLVAWLLNANLEDLSQLTFPTPAPTATPTLTPTIDITVADVGVTIATNTISPREGDALVYTISAVNNGPQLAHDVLVEVNLPLEVTYLTGTTRRPFDQESLTWDIGALDIGETQELTIIVLVNQGTAERRISASARISTETSTDNETANDLAAAEVTIQAREG